MLTLAGRGLLDVGKVPMGFESIMGSRWDCFGNGISDSDW